MIFENTQIMKIPFLIFTIIILTTNLCNAQKIEAKKVFGGYKYSFNGDRLSLKELEEILEKNSESFKFFKKAKSNLILSSILNLSGGALIGIPIGQSLSGKDTNWVLAGIGTGLAITGLTIYSSANKKINKSIEIYNSEKIVALNYEFRINSTLNGLSLSVRF